MSGVAMSLEDSLIKLAVTGDREAQRLVYESLKDSIRRLVSRIVDESDVDDVTQDIFLHVFCSLGSFRFESEFTTWVYRLAVNDACSIFVANAVGLVPLENLEMPGQAQQNIIENNEMLVPRAFEAGPGTSGHSAFEGGAGRMLRNDCRNSQNPGRDGRIAAQSGSAGIEERTAGSWLGRLT
jgi:hypothetical protein